ncbi:metallophosphoesterase [Agrobacterium salinitolerans]|nr:metallophosphoesterase [Agrobacterium salinitolerans]
MQTIDFIIGDVHGRADLLMRLMGFMQRHARARGAQARYTFLGDLIDRGPGSRECVDIAIATVASHEGSAMLLGNHEHMMLDAIDSNGKSELSGSWAINGGMATIESYMGRIDVHGLFPALRAQYPHHVEALRNAPLMVERHGLLAVHAGIDPKSDLASQGVEILTGIRDRFLDHVDPNQRPVIHGHEIVGRLPEVTENRISIDTGAHAYGRLTACIVDPDTWEISFAQATTSGCRYVEPKRLDRGFGTLLDDPKRVFEGQRAPAAVKNISQTTSFASP